MLVVGCFFNVIVFVCLRKVFIIVYRNLGWRRICLFKQCVVLVLDCFLDVAVFACLSKVFIISYNNLG